MRWGRGEGDGDKREGCGKLCPRQGYLRVWGTGQSVRGVDTGVRMDTNGGSPNGGAGVEEGAAGVPKRNNVHNTYD